MLVTACYADACLQRCTHEQEGKLLTMEAGVHAGEEVVPIIATWPCPAGQGGGC